MNAAMTGRLTTPLVREEGGLRPASWDEALDRAAEGLRPARAICLDQRALVGEARGQHLDGFGPRPAGILGRVPVLRRDLGKEALHGCRILEQRAVQVARIPVDEDTAEIEDDRRRR